VPWPLRLLLAPLMRRRLVRWSDNFTSLVADRRACRTVEPAGDFAVEQPHLDDPCSAAAALDDPCGAAAARGRDRSTPLTENRAAAQRDPVDPPVVVVLSERRGPAFVGYVDRPRLRTDASILRFPQSAGAAAPRRWRRGGINHCGPPAFFRGAVAHALHGHFVTISYRKMRTRPADRGGRPRTACARQRRVDEPRASDTVASTSRARPVTRHQSASVIPRFADIRQRAPGCRRIRDDGAACPAPRSALRRAVFVAAFR
jgi:hypothetical protein